MDVKVTAYLKSGGNVSMVMYGTSLKELFSKYSEALENGSKHICFKSRSEVSFIPVSNIALLSLKELPE